MHPDAIQDLCPSQEQTMKIAVSGCGIAGATVAFLLAEQGHAVTVFEQAGESLAVGAGILVSPTGQQMLHQAGILAGLMEHSAWLEGMLAVLENGRRLTELRYGWLDGQLFGLGVHRGRLFERLLERCRAAGVEIRNGFCVETCEERARELVLRDTSGACATGFDCMVVADGSRSRLRKKLFPATRVVEYRHAALWVTAPCDFQPGHLYQVVRGTNRLVGLLPIGKGESSFFWGLPADSFQPLKQAGFAAWRDEVLGICPESESVFSTVSSFGQLTYARYRHVVMPRWHTERVLFLGDAAHATSPHLGQGVNLALQDAVCFAECLASSHGFGDACRNWVSRRRRQLRYYQQLTRLISPFFQSHGNLLAGLRDFGLPLLGRVPWTRRQMLRTLCGFKQGWLK